ncbi:MAG TPA: hypothetical protein VGO22_23700 [Pseudorhizobium sp.]|nr:hypothetical protein [Pseudorhizobium sp.]
MSGVGEGTTASLGRSEIIRSAFERVAAGLDVASNLDQIVILRIVSLLYESGVRDPQKLADAAFLLGSSKLFTGVL